MAVTKRRKVKTTLPSETKVKPKTKKKPVVLEAPVAVTCRDKRKTVQWVADNLAVANVVVESAPGSEAIGMLLWARGNQGDFWRIWSRLLPNQTMIEMEQSLKKRDNKLNEAIDKVLRIREAAVQVAGNYQETTISESAIHPPVIYTDSDHNEGGDSEEVSVLPFGSEGAGGADTVSPEPTQTGVG